MRVIVGTIIGAYGVRGWVKLRSDTDPADNILKYSPWLLSEPGGVVERRVIDGRAHGGLVVTRLEGVTDRDQAALLRGVEISIPRSRLPELKRGEYYWADLVGMEVRTLAGASLGTVAAMMATGANDVLVVEGERERLLPFVMGEFVKEVRLDEHVIIVEWDPDF